MKVCRFVKFSNLDIERIYRMKNVKFGNENGKNHFKSLFTKLSP